jgi:K+:H+ antiporter
MPHLALQEFVIVLAASVLIIYVSHKLRLPSVVGFLLTGVLIGPGGLSLVKNTATVNVLAEIGVVMLLFTIGLEFEPARLRQIQRYLWAGGGLQVSLTTSATVLVLVLLKVSFREALFYGFLVSLSSTAVVLKILADRGETDAPQGRIALGVLIFQDLAIVPMIALVPVLANAGAFSLGAIGARFGLSALAIGAAFVLARVLMPRVLHLVVRTRIREVFLIATLFIVLGMAALTASLGLSLALGAFLAGVVLAESEYTHQVVSDILPFKDVFNSVFFISVGMLLDVGAVWEFRTLVLVLVASILLVKFVAVVLTVGLLGYGSRIAVLTGLALAQIGEFSFVLAGVGRANGLLPDDIFQTFVASSVLTILATPFLIRSGPRLAALGEKGLPWKQRQASEAAPAACDLDGHVIIAGYGLNGRNLAHVLQEAGIGYFIIELNPVTVREAAAAGERIIFGDVSSPTILTDAGVRRAKAIVFAISDPLVTRRGVKTARELNPGLFIIVRTRFAAETDDLLRLGADDVIPEEFETSIEIFTRVLEKYHVPSNIIAAQVKVLRGECYGMLRGSCSAVRPVAGRIADLLAAGTAETYFVGQSAWPAGRTLGALDLRGRTGATVLAVVRGEESFTSPGADFEVREQDTLVLVASHRDIDRAFNYLGSGRADDRGAGGEGGEG